MEFSQRLKALRADKNLTQEDLGKLLDVGKSTISLYESGKREPDFSTLKKLSEIFNVTSDYLLGQSDIKRPYKLPSWLDKLPNDLKAQMENLIATGDMGALYLRAGIGMAKNAQLSDYPPDALEAIAKAAIDGGMMVRKKRLELEREGKAKEKEDQ